MGLGRVVMSGTALRLDEGKDVIQRNKQKRALLERQRVDVVDRATVTLA